MNKDILSGQWKQLKGEVHRKWGKLTDDDLEMIKGDREKLVGRLQERYGYSREEADMQVDRFMRDSDTGTMRSDRY